MNNKRTIILISILIVILILVIVSLVLTLGKKEEIIPENTVNETEENVVEENVIIDEVEEEENLPIIEDKGEIATERSIYIDDNRKSVTVPEGYAIINDSPNVSDGLVISDVADDDLNNSKGGNQFVWIPVDTPVLDVSKCEDEMDINDAISESVSNRKYPMAIKLADGNYKGVLYRFESINENTAVKVNFIAYSTTGAEREPANLDDSSANIGDWTQEIYQTEYNELVKRVKKDKGFWIARYETSIDSNNVAQSKKNEKVLTNASWYDLYTVQKTLTHANTTSHMIWGSQWDQIMIWLKDVKNQTLAEGYKYFVVDSSNMGNYLYTEIKENGENGNNTIKKSGEAFRFKTGELEGTKINNIYDLAGNAWEWTMEANFTTSRTVRGGDCSYDGATYPVTARFSFKPTYNGEKIENIGSRMTIY